MEKLKTCPEFKEKLQKGLDDGREFIEDNSDIYWASGTREKKGQNVMGKILQEIAEECLTKGNPQTKEEEIPRVIQPGTSMPRENYFEAQQTWAEEPWGYRGYNQAGGYNRGGAYRGNRYIRGRGRPRGNFSRGDRGGRGHYYW